MAKTRRTKVKRRSSVTVKPSPIASKKGKGKGRQMTGQRTQAAALKSVEDCPPTPVTAGPSTAESLSSSGESDKAQRAINIELGMRNRIHAHLDDLERDPDVQRAMQKYNWTETMLTGISKPGDRKQDGIKLKDAQVWISENPDRFTPQRIAKLVINAVIQKQAEVASRSVPENSAVNDTK